MDRRGGKFPCKAEKFLLLIAGYEQFFKRILVFSLGMALLLYGLVFACKQTESFLMVSW